MFTDAQLHEINRLLELRDLWLALSKTLRELEQSFDGLQAKGLDDEQDRDRIQQVRDQVQDAIDDIVNSAQLNPMVTYFTSRNITPAEFARLKNKGYDALSRARRFRDEINIRVKTGAYPAPQTPHNLPPGPGASGTLLPNGTRIGNGVHTGPGGIGGPGFGGGTPSLPGLGGGLLGSLGGHRIGRGPGGSQFIPGVGFFPGGG